jgi:HK97 family phage major capsid protein
MLWGLPVVATNAIAQGTALVGAFQLGATLYRRDGLRLETTNSDASDFVYNRIAIRVEERIALAVFRPLAFSTVTAIPAV